MNAAQISPHKEDNSGPPSHAYHLLLLLSDVRDGPFDRIAHHVEQYVRTERPLVRNVPVEVCCSYYPEVLGTWGNARRRPRSGYAPPPTSRVGRYLENVHTVVCLWYGQAHQVFALFPAHTRRVVCVYECLRWTTRFHPRTSGRASLPLPLPPVSSVEAYRNHLRAAVTAADAVLYACETIREALLADLFRDDDGEAAEDKHKVGGDGGDRTAWCYKMAPCIDGVDTSLFVPRVPPSFLPPPSPALSWMTFDAASGMTSPPLRIGWAGTSSTRQGGTIMALPPNGKDRDVANVVADTDDDDDDDPKGLALIREAVSRAGGWLQWVVCDNAAVDDGKAHHEERQRRSHAAMPDFYRSLDVYVCMSTCEGTPNPVLEAASCGCPVVSTPVGIVPQLSLDDNDDDGDDGGGEDRRGIVVLGERNVDALLQALAVLWRETPQQRAQRGQRARRAIERGRWDWQRYAAQAWVTSALGAYETPGAAAGSALGRNT